MGKIEFGRLGGNLRKYVDRNPVQTLKVGIFQPEKKQNDR